MPRSQKNTGMPASAVWTCWVTFAASACWMWIAAAEKASSSFLIGWGSAVWRVEGRGVFAAAEERVALATGLAVSLCAGVVMQRFTDMDDLYGGFLFASLAILVFSALDMLCILLMRDREQSEEAKKTPFKEVLKNTLGNRAFLSILLFSVLVTMASYNVVGFLGTYKVGELSITLTMVQIINIIGAAGRMVLSRPFGRLTDKTSFLYAARISLLLVLASFAVLIFTKPSTWWLMIVYVLRYNGAQAGLNANMTNITYS